MQAKFVDGEYRIDERTVEGDALIAIGECVP